MNTLYISDLDGTLLNEHAQLSNTTLSTLRELIDSGVSFTCATARTAATVTHILKELPIPVPVILMNGVAILDWTTKHYINVHYLTSKFCSVLQKQLKIFHLTAFFYSIENNQLATYYDILYNQAMHDFYYERRTLYQKEYIRVESIYNLTCDHIMYALLLDSKERLLPFVNWLREIQDCMSINFSFYPDVYLQDTWCLEIYHKNASKYSATKFLRQHYGFDYIIGFGDNLNDLPLSRACDEFYAVSNAKEALKNIATGIIESNIDEGVVKFMKQREHLVKSDLDSTK